jgi:hypothetical protein
LYKLNHVFALYGLYKHFLGEDASEDERGRRDEKEKISLSWQDEWSDSKNEGKRSFLSCKSNN